MKVPFQIKFWTCKIPLSYPEPAPGIHRAYLSQGIQPLCIGREWLVPWQRIRSVAAGVYVWLLVLTAHLQGVTLWEGRKWKDGRKLKERAKELKGSLRGHILDQRDIIPGVEWFVFMSMKDNLSSSLWSSWAGFSEVSSLISSCCCGACSWGRHCLLLLANGRHIWAGKVLFWYSHRLRIKELSPYLLVPTEQGKQHYEQPFGMKGSRFLIQFPGT